MSGSEIPRKPRGPACSARSKEVNNHAMETIAEDYPFRCLLSFRPLIDHLREEIRLSDGRTRFGEKELNEILEAAPELEGPFENPAAIKKYQAQIDLLMARVFPDSFWEVERIAAVVPFSMRPVLVSSSFRRLFLEEDGSLKGRRNLREEDFNRGRVIRAYLLILEKFYGIESRFDFPLVHIVTDPDTGLESYFKMDLDFRFVAVQPARNKHPRELDNALRAEIMEHLTEPARLKEMLPPDDYEIHGFTVLRAVDVTQTEVLSALERDLVDQGSIISREGFGRLQERLRVLFRRPNLIAGLAAIQDDQVLLLNTGCDMKRSCIFTDSRHVSVDEFEGSVFERAVKSESIVRVADLRESAEISRSAKDMLEVGIRSVLVAPLYYRGECIGTLDVGSPEPADLGALDTLVMEHIQPIFAMAVKRALDDLDNRIQGIIKKECTAIHPIVEWRFRRAALNYLEKLRLGQSPEIEPIVFHQVYPLYGSSDVRGSADERNKAIQQDLARHLELALRVMEKARAARPLFILEETANRIRSSRDRILKDLGSGDEVSVLNFLQKEVVPLFSHLKTFGSQVESAIQDYETAVDPTAGTVYRLRKAFEESVSLLNDRMAAYLDSEESKLQSVFPHYFERHRTDGVDYLAYMGRSLLEEGEFSELYLRNMRLWQLRVACGLAWHTEQLKARLSVPLDTAHLVLFQNRPLSIRFRYDEKRFDVDGAYDIRHEIIKSRIDKAVVKGSRERLTQPGKVAAVFTHPEEARELRRHIEFLLSEDFLSGEPEELALGDLPGVQGLKAYRVRVNLESRALASAAGEDSWESVG